MEKGRMAFVWLRKKIASPNLVLSEKMKNTKTAMNRLEYWKSTNEYQYKSSDDAQST